MTGTLFWWVHFTNCFVGEHRGLCISGRRGTRGLREEISGCRGIYTLGGRSLTVTGASGRHPNEILEGRPLRPSMSGPVEI